MSGRERERKIEKLKKMRNGLDRLGIGSLVNSLFIICGEAIRQKVQSCFKDN